MATDTAAAPTCGCVKEPASLVWSRGITIDRVDKRVEASRDLGPAWPITRPLRVPEGGTLDIWITVTEGEERRKVEHHRVPGGSTVQVVFGSVRLNGQTADAVASHSRSRERGAAAPAATTLHSASETAAVLTKTALVARAALTAMSVLQQQQQQQQQRDGRERKECRA